MTVVQTATLVLAVATAGANAAPGDHLASLIGDRVAGAPTDCIDRLDIDAVHVFDGGIVYEMKTGRTFYLNRPSSGAAFLHDGVILTVDFAPPRLCQGEPVGAVNANSRAPVARVTLGRFVPYTRAVTP